MTPWKINLDDVPEEHQEWTWKTGKYERYRRHVSVALGNTPETPHPFDVELTRLPPGARPCPVHSHDRMWEFFIVVSGRAVVDREGEATDSRRRRLLHAAGLHAAPDPERQRHGRPGLLRDRERPRRSHCEPQIRGLIGPAVAARSARCCYSYVNVSRPARSAFAPGPSIGPRCTSLSQNPLLRSSRVYVLHSSPGDPNWGFPSPPVRSSD